MGSLVYPEPLGGDISNLMRPIVSANNLRASSIRPHLSACRTDVGGHRTDVGGHRTDVGGHPHFLPHLTSDFQLHLSVKSMKHQTESQLAPLDTCTLTFDLLHTRTAIVRGLLEIMATGEYTDRHR